MRDIDEMLLDGPIPGESLTAEPGNYPWEQPPQYVDPEDAIAYHIGRLSSGDKLDSVFDALEMGISVDSLTSMILTGASMNGVHNVDVSILVGPVLHEFIASAAKKAGIDYKDNLSDGAKKEAHSKRRSRYMAMKAMLDFEPTPDTPAAAESMQTDEMMLDTPDDTMYNEDALMQQGDTTMAETDTAAPRGLMSRGI
jgi:hypothetical protein